MLNQSKSVVVNVFRADCFQADNYVGQRQHGPGVLASVNLRQVSGVAFCCVPVVSASQGLGWYGGNTGLRRQRQRSVQSVQERRQVRCLHQAEGENNFFTATTWLLYAGAVLALARWGGNGGTIPARGPWGPQYAAELRILPVYLSESLGRLGQNGGLLEGGGTFFIGGA